MSVERIIDAHMHFSNIGTFKDTAELYSRVDYSYGGYVRECRECGVTASVCMGLTETEKFSFPDAFAETPMMADLSAKTPDAMYICPGVNPHRLSGENLNSLEDILRSKINVGIKIYAGYYHVDIRDSIYAPAYELARKYSLPVVIHSGDTYSERGLLEYSHPLHVDRLAVNYRDVNFVIAHMGDPWIMDACETAYKNRNVYLDISGLIVGDGSEIRRVGESVLMMNRFKTGLEFLNDYKKLLFGTDWPLVPMNEYIEFCKNLVPEYAHGDVFYDNARRVFCL